MAMERMEREEGTISQTTVLAGFLFLTWGAALWAFFPDEKQ